MEIWIGRDGERHGPYKEDDVRQWLRSGQVSPADLAWYEGLADWQPLSVLFPGEAGSAPTAAGVDAESFDNAAVMRPWQLAAQDRKGFRAGERFRNVGENVA